MKNILRIITLTIVIVIYAIGIFNGIDEYQNGTYQDCGTIISKSQDEVTIKYGSRTELYLNVKFINSGFKSILVDPTTYFKNKIGNNICFQLNKENTTLFKISVVFSFFVTLMCLITLFLVFIYYLID
jgi:hypothetical protein